MAESPSSSHPPPPQPPTTESVPDNPDSTQYWCHQCNKRVLIETLPGQADVICFECKNGFVELIQVHHSPSLDADQPAFVNEFYQVLRLIAMAARDDEAPPSPPDHRDGDDNDYLRIELGGWDENDDDGNDDNEDEEVENRNQVDPELDRSDAHDVNEDEQQIVEEEDEDDHLRRRQRRDVIRLRLRDFATRALSRRHRILDWAEILTGLEDHSIAVSFEDGDNYVGNPGDYVDAAGYETLLQTLAESDTGGKGGAPPAASSAVEALPTVEVKATDIEVCAICKDKLSNNEEEIVKQLPCGHMYHEDCIVPWLGSRNTCPVCRYELPTDDLEYEEDRMKRLIAMAATSTSTSSDDAVL
ncbi:hypothetical protein E3N88_40305 [Mikania micrantha]|uniref:RING-type E3 ubiquitin transferase n=1 Tax=Mikania micrantha TaxID=192012 RepID=A0A5N6LPJ4_9ASTR|nr:hypothetical protein E3N88_40305 [Mikania micrantha]